MSSQEVSGLLLALAAHPDEHELQVWGSVPSRPYLDLTLRLLASFGVHVTESPSSHGSTFRVRGPLAEPQVEVRVEPDASSAAVFLVATCLSGGTGRVPALGPESCQGDVRIVEHLGAFGVHAAYEADGLVARGAPTRGATLDLAGEPDLAPVLCAVAADAARRGESSRLEGLGTLPGKESDRLAVLTQGLRAAGWQAACGSDWLEIGPAPGGVPRRAPDGGDGRDALARPAR